MEEEEESTYDMYMSVEDANRLQSLKKEYKEIESKSTSILNEIHKLNESNRAARQLAVRQKVNDMMYMIGKKSIVDEGMTIFKFTGVQELTSESGVWVKAISIDMYNSGEIFLRNRDEWFISDPEEIQLASPEDVEKLPKHLKDYLFEAEEADRE